MYLVLPTKYKTINDLRYKLFLRTLKVIKVHMYIKKVIIVDTSSKEVRREMKKLEDDRIEIIEQENDGLLKGAAIREGIKYTIGKYGRDIVLGFQEPEKDSMIYHYRDIINDNKHKDKWICNPKRLNMTWETYPKEQYYSENFMNNYLKMLTGLDIDFSFGPVVMNGYAANYFLEYEGKLWDAQIVPIYRAYKKGLEISEYKVPFMYPHEQKNEEENNMFYIRKRKYQMDYMIEKMEEEISRKNNE